MPNNKGFSLVETLLVIVLIGSIVVLLANIPNSMNLINKSRHLSLAREIASKQLEDKRAVSFANLADGTESILDSRLSLLPQGSGTILVEDCDQETICTNLEEIKKVTVVVNWEDNQKLQTIALSTFIAEGGLNQ